MSCTDNSCGTGGWGGPLPGDPDNNISITATSAYGGIDVNWVFPASNAFAIAYAIVYRGLSADFNAAIQIGNDTDGFYFDRVEPGRLYYYWIVVISINGTRAEPIGPASASAKATIEQTLRDLSGMIDAGHLAESLRDKVSSITQLSSDFQQEVIDRFGADSELALAVQGLQANVDQIGTYVAQEIVERQTADSALVDSMSLIGARALTNAAAIIEEATVRAGKDDALAQRITTIESTGGAASELIAQAEQRMETKIDAVKQTAESLYTIKLTAGNLIGGFGLYNNSSFVQAGFDVDEFWVGRTNADKIKPFIVVGGTTYINEAVINRITFSKLRADDGSVIVENGKMKAQYIETSELNVVASSIDTTHTNGNATVRITNKGMAVYINGQIRGFFGDDS